MMPCSFLPVKSVAFDTKEQIPVSLHIPTSLRSAWQEKYDSVMRRSNVIPQSVDMPIARLAAEIRDHYRQTDFELLTPDAIHLATAIYLKAEEFHTFDGSNAKKTPRQSAKYLGWV
jgi:predicted nucleic acid-binding protein